ncbi:MAG: ornithine carbamoyltransferase [Nitrososphaerota archaeon]
MALSHFKGRDFITTRDFTKEDLEFLLDLSSHFKSMFYGGMRKTLRDVLEGRNIALLFKKPSTRTRNSFQVAASRLGALSVYMRPDELQLARGEPIIDTANVLDRYYDGLVIRTFEQAEVEEYARYMKNPVINALTDEEHPCQAMADLLTIIEKKSRLDGLRMVYTGDVWNVCHSLITVAPVFGIDLIIAVPRGYEPLPEIWKFGQDRASRNGTRLEIVHDIREAVKGADIVYANTWWSMGKPEMEKEKRKIDFKPFTVTADIMNLAKEDAIFMHCLPAYRGNEMTTEVIEGKWSVVYDQAENRLWTEAAILAALIS